MIYKFGIISQFRNESPYLAEWVAYHRLVGVDHFWLYDDGSSDDWKSVLAPHLAEGVIEVLPLPEQYAQGAPTAIKQPGTFRDGLLRARGKARWVAVIDADEFLLPRTEATVPECLDLHFSEASGIYVNWRMFGTNRQIVPSGKPLLTALTACSKPYHAENANGKSLVKPEHVAVDRVWSPHHFPLLPEERYLDSGGNEIFFTTRHGREDLLTTGYHFEPALRINHYNLRDELFFAANRVPRARAGQLPGKSLDRLIEHYDSFGKCQNRDIINFLDKHHPASFATIWGKP
jgi:hypothetical protein